MATILIIEENPKIRENPNEIPELEKHTVIVAKNGNHGLKMAYENLQDIILFDIMLPELNGYQVLTKKKY